MYFCPHCSNLLLVRPHDGANALSCQTCPYVFPLDEPMTQRQTFVVKEIDDILGGEEAWENVDQTEATCQNPKCGYNKAYYFTLQIRSADEPSTAFYRCVKCGFRWNSNE